MTPAVSSMWGRASALLIAMWGRASALQTGARKQA
jgi:hypothetical protein